MINFISNSKNVLRNLDGSGFIASDHLNAKIINSILYVGKNKCTSAYSSDKFKIDRRMTTYMTKIFETISNKCFDAMLLKMINNESIIFKDGINTKSIDTISRNVSVLSVIDDYIYVDDIAFVYALRSGDYIKIGVAKTVDQRVNTLQTGNPIKIEIEHLKKTNNVFAYIDEKILHKKFKKYHVINEWYRIDKDNKDLIKYFTD